MNKDIRVVFMGTPEFAVPVLEGLIDNYKVVLVVCQPDRMKNRKGKVIIPPIKEIANKYNIPVFQPLSIRKEYDRIVDINPDLIITCAYGQIIPDEILNCTKYGCINVHGSLLPDLRGGAPIHWAIIRGYKETGMTVMSMSKEMDAGDIISQAKLDIGEDEILDSLMNRMSLLGRDLLLETLPSIIDGTCKYIKQDESLVTFGYNITREEEKINFNSSVRDVYNHIRGLSSHPGAYCIFNGKRMKIYKAVILDNSDNLDKYSDGEIIKIGKDGFVVKCSDGLLMILEIGLEGKSRCMVSDFLNGIKVENIVGKVLNS